MFSRNMPSNVLYLPLEPVPRSFKKVDFPLSERPPKLEYASLFKPVFQPPSLFSKLL